MSAPIRWKICGYEFEWFDIKTKFKQLLRRFAYSKIIQELICILLSSYMRLVYLTSKKVFIGDKSNRRSSQQQNSHFIFLA